MKLRWTDQARKDLLGIGRYIARDKPGAARKWVTRLRQRARQAAEAPYSGRSLPEVGREEVREILGRGYRIVYRSVGDEVHILTVFEGHRRLRRSDLEAPE